MDQKRKELTFDGKGINGPDAYRSRIATFTTDEDAAKYGKLLENAPELRDALKTADQRITELCAMVNTLAGFRKVRAEDYAEEIRSALAQIEKA